MTYADYLQSSDWKITRSRALSKNNSCELCGHKHSLHVHHKSYRNGTQKNVLGNEPDYLLTVLCKECHYLWHELFGKIKLRKGKIKNIQFHLKNGLSKKEAFILCNSRERSHG